MAEERLRKVIEAYGADPARWPNEAALDPAAVAGADPVVLAEAKRLDALLAVAKPAADPIGEKRVLAGLARLPAQPRPAWERARSARPRRGLDGGLWTRFAGLLAASLVGLVLGLSDLAAPIGPDEADLAPDFAALVLDETPMAGLE
jgi:hypothetical protein